MLATIRVSKTDYFRNGSGSRSEVFPTAPRGSHSNPPKVLKITIPYHMELGGVFKMVPPIRSPLFGHSPRSGRITVASAVANAVASTVAFRGAPQLLTPLSKILAGTLPEPAFWRGGGQNL